MNCDFTVSECKNCKNILWPPTKYCNICFKKTTYRNGKKDGKLLEFSKKDRRYFCIAEFENKIKLFGEIVEGIPKHNAKVYLKECQIKNGDYLFKMTIDS